MNQTSSDPIISPPNPSAAAAVANNPRREKRDLAELLEAATRILPEYAEKLDKLVQAALTIWDRREKLGIRYTKDIPAAVDRDLDPLLKAALLRLGREFLGLSEPLRQWINALSAVVEEGPISEVQRMELRLRLIELEGKFGTAGQLLKQLNVL